MYDDAVTDHEIQYGKVYYVVVDDDGNPVVDADGNYQVTEDETSMRLDVNCAFLTTVDYDNEIWAYLVDELSIDDQIVVQGNEGWSSPELTAVNKLRESVVDGPGESGNGNSSYGINTWFTSAVVNASTWNPYLINKMGVVYAHQSIKNGLAGAYCPAMNTHRTPFGGRNFEYYSEDGFIGGKIGLAEVCGLQPTGIYVYIKHMAMNDNDTNRDGNITWFSEQAAREIMLKDYEICVKETYVVDDETQTGHYESGEGVLGIMASLNRDGISMFHPGLYRTILRNEWGFNGLVITDGVGPYPWVMSPGAGLFGGVEGQLGGSTVTTYYQYEGDTTSTNYGKYLLRQTSKHLLYQICHSGKLVRGETNAMVAMPAWKVMMYIIDGLFVALIALVVYAGFILPIRKRKEKVLITVDDGNDENQQGGK